MKKRKNQAWEEPFQAWCKRHEGETLTPELADRRIILIWKHRAKWMLEAMRNRE